MNIDEELHDRLMHAIREYYKANNKLMARGSKRACMDTRFWLNEIRKLSIDRRLALMEWRYWKNEDFAKKKADKKAQKEAKAQAQDDN